MVARLWFACTFLIGTTAFAADPHSGPLPKGEGEKSDKRPNIVVVLIDDVGWSDLGCYGGEIPTPHIDALAAGGVRFTQFYNCARCSPTRASLLTGLYPHQAGMGWLDGKVEPKSKGFHGVLLPRSVTIAEVLKQSGYFTAMTGKWHMGQQHGCVPWNQGFDRSLNSRYGEVYFPKEASRPGTENLYLNGKEIPKSDPIFGQDWYSTDLFTEWGLKFIDEAKAEKKPFFLYIAQGAAHFPLRAPREIIDKYQETYRAGWDKLRAARYARQIEMGLIDKRWPLAPRPEQSPAWDTREPDRQDRFVQMMATYAAMIDRIDHAMGTLVAGLKERGVYENTLILFLHDNGGNAEGGPVGITDGEGPIGGPNSRVFLGMNWATLNNTPFARYKHFTHEGGIATPLIAHWPAGIGADPLSRRAHAAQPGVDVGGNAEPGVDAGAKHPKSGGRMFHEPAHLIDVMATAVDLAGAAYPAKFNEHDILPMEGVSLRPAFAVQPGVDDTLSRRAHAAKPGVDAGGNAIPGVDAGAKHAAPAALLNRQQPIFWEHEGNKAVREGKWKLVQRHKQPWQLFDMAADRTEQHDSIEDHPEIATRLEKAWSAWAGRTFVDEWPGPDHTDWGADIK
jgi:arylsulfatase